MTAPQLVCSAAQWPVDKLCVEHGCPCRWRRTCGDADRPSISTATSRRSRRRTTSATLCTSEITTQGSHFGKTSSLHTADPSRCARRASKERRPQAQASRCQGSLRVWSYWQRTSTARRCTNRACVDLLLSATQFCALVSRPCFLFNQIPLSRLTRRGFQFRATGADVNASSAVEANMKHIPHNTTKQVVK